MTNEKLQRVRNALGVVSGVSKTQFKNLRPRAKRFRERTIEVTADAADKTTARMQQIVHHAMGTEDYQREAAEINHRLSEALRTLEDSIRRRDRDIAALKNEVSELRAKLYGQQHGE
jgi:hypothetical protein